MGAHSLPKAKLLRHSPAAIELEMSNHDMKFTQTTPHDVHDNFAYYVFYLKGRTESDYLCQLVCTFFASKNDSINCAATCSKLGRRVTELNKRNKKLKRGVSELSHEIAFAIVLSLV